MKTVGQAGGLGPGSSEKEPGAGSYLFVSKAGRVWWRLSRGSHTHTEET